MNAESIVELIGELTASVTKRYRIDAEFAERIVLETFADSKKLSETVLTGTSADKLRRTRAYKQAADAAKRNVYYRLRAYRGSRSEKDAMLERLLAITPDDAREKRDQAVEGVLLQHASTRERYSTRHDFYRCLFEQVAPPGSVLDVGCGVHPLMFPFEAEWSKSMKRYVAVDASSHDVACTEAYAKLVPAAASLISLQWDLSEGWDSVMAAARQQPFDVAFLMKVVPVVHRQHRDLLPLLCETPAATWLVSGSRVSLTKRVSIERRERRVLADFVQRAGREIRGEFTVGEEFVWVVT